MDKSLTLSKWQSKASLNKQTLSILPKNFKQTLCFPLSGLFLRTRRSSNSLGWEQRKNKEAKENNGNTKETNPKPLIFLVCRTGQQILFDWAHRCFVFLDLHYLASFTWTLFSIKLQVSRPQNFTLGVIWGCRIWFLTFKSKMKINYL